MGRMMMHEVTETYEGAKISQRVGVGVGPATQADLANPNSVYNKAHNRATSQTTVYRQFYDNRGNKTDNVNEATRVEWYVNKNGKSQIIRVLE